MLLLSHLASHQNWNNCLTIKQTNDRLTDFQVMPGETRSSRRQFEANADTIDWYIPFNERQEKTKIKTTENTQKITQINQSIHILSTHIFPYPSIVILKFFFANVSTNISDDDSHNCFIHPLSSS